MYSTELWRIIPQNRHYDILEEKSNEGFSQREFKRIDGILNEIHYIMSEATYDLNGRFIGSYGSLGVVSPFRKFYNGSVFLYYKENFISFTKLVDDYILITFAKDYKRELVDIRFSVKCDDIEGVIDFYDNIMHKDNFIPKIMLGERI
jgi:hypothetical protein